jgi:4-amino-4-deoxy-L-arabinose transferase-like glycosyltransferase
LLLLAAFLIVSATSMRRQALTWDEAAHLRYGKQILALNSNSFDLVEMPITAINGLPDWIGAHIPIPGAAKVLGKLQVARIPTVLLSALAGLVLFNWVREMYGRRAGLLVLFLYVFEPNILAHSQFATSDAPFMAMVVFASYALWRYWQHRSWGRAVALGIALGCAQWAKYTALSLYPVFALILLLCGLTRVRELIRQGRVRELASKIAIVAAQSLVALLIGLALINVGWVLNRSCAPLAEYKFRYEPFQRMQAALSDVPALRVPAPIPYVVHLDLGLYLEATDTEGHQRYYLLGTLSREPFKGYYIVAVLFKSPLAIQLLLLLALGVYLRRGWYKDFLRKDVFLFTPILFFVAYFNLLYRAQIGIRHFLIVFPYLLAFAASILRDTQLPTRRAMYGLAALGVYLVASTLSYFPHFMPYLNELVPDRRLGYRVLADSNIDWGQSAWYVTQWQKDHPAAAFEPDGPQTGEVVVAVNDLLGVSSDEGKYQWLRDNFLPDEVIAYTHLVYEIDQDELASIR